MAINSFKHLLVWQKSMGLVKLIYAIPDRLPATERHGLASQLQCAATSIPSDIAEGSKRGTQADSCQFYRIALGSASETETQLLLVKDIYQIAVQNILIEVESIQKMLTALGNRLASPINHRQKTIN